MSPRMFWPLARLLLVPTQVQAQAPIPVRELTTIEARSAETVGFIRGIRELSDGRVVANDTRSRRLLLYDKALGTPKVIVDSAVGAAVSYGPRATTIMAYAGDSTVLVDLAGRAFLLIDGNGAVTRIMSPPRPRDVNQLGGGGSGIPGFDPQGRLIYRGFLFPSFTPPEPGKPFTPPVIPDSAPILRADFDRRSADTLGWVRIAKMRVQTTYLKDGGVTLSPMINPIATIDDWALLGDGTIAILRGLDYHIDWIDPDGSRRSSPKMAFDWKRLTDDEKAAIIDSTRKALANPRPGGSMMTGPIGTPMPAGHGMTIKPVTRGDGPTPRSEATPTVVSVPPEVVPPGDLPDYLPPILQSGGMRADRDGNLWVLPSTSAQAGAGLLYDVINRKGELLQRVRLPAGRALEGFGAGGAVYLTSHDSTGVRLERARLSLTQE